MINQHINTLKLLIHKQSLSPILKQLYHKKSQQIFTPPQKINISKNIIRTWK
jgi:hypothetical protein